ncbi:MAG: hypothetical protein IJ388_01995 [Oscillospiraceae bacterium]|nr:hypothetical protein [Oscillospiraceae bacterium]
MRRIFAYILLLTMAVSLVGCTKPAKENLSIEEKIANLAPDTVEAFVKSYDNTIYRSLYRLDGKLYGRVISSSESAEDAVNVCTRHFTDERYLAAINTVFECKVIYESELLYGLYVKWGVFYYGEPDGEFEENVISFKKSVADITIPQIFGDLQDYKIYTDQDEQIEKIALYAFINKYLDQCMLEYKTLCSDKEVIVDVYAYLVVYGDWGIPDTYYFRKYTVSVDKTTGKVTFQPPTLLKTVEKY